MGGIQFSPRCSMTMVQGANNQAYTFGGVFDVEKDDEDIAGNFYNDMFNLDLEKIVWRTVLLLGKKDKENKSRRKNDVEGNGNAINFVRSLILVCEILKLLPC